MRTGGNLLEERSRRSKRCRTSTRRRGEVSRTKQAKEKKADRGEDENLNEREGEREEEREEKAITVKTTLQRNPSSTRSRPVLSSFEALQRT